MNAIKSCQLCGLSPRSVAHSIQAFSLFGLFAGQVGDHYGQAYTGIEQQFVQPAFLAGSDTGQLLQLTGNKTVLPKQTGPSKPPRSKPLHSKGA